MSQTIDIPHAMIDALRTAESVAVLTGAGVSAESGVPTFRDALTGLWAKYDPLQLATPEAFARDGQLVTRWYDQRRLAALAAEPNAAHHALVDLAALLAARDARFTLVTQNVDRLHQRAGSRDVIELHGALTAWRCDDCGATRDEQGPAFDRYPPICDACGGPRRPGVVWFGEVLPHVALGEAMRAARSCDLLISVGTSAVVYPAAGVIDLAVAAGATTIEGTAEPTPATARVTFALHGRAGAILPAILARLR